MWECQEFFKKLLFFGFLEISWVNLDALDSQVYTLLSFLDYLFNFKEGLFSKYYECKINQDRQIQLTKLLEGHNLFF